MTVAISVSKVPQLCTRRLYLFPKPAPSHILQRGVFILDNYLACWEFDLDEEFVYYIFFIRCAGAGQNIAELSHATI